MQIYSKPCILAKLLAKNFMDFTRIKNLIFDLGGVVIDIDFALTHQALSNLYGQQGVSTTGSWMQQKFWQRYESGEWTAEEFRKYVYTTTGLTCSDEDFDSAWNALLLELPAERVELLKRLRPKYRMFVLSNTNTIHIPAVEQILEQSSGVKSLHDLFDTVYYSYEIGHVKPFAESYLHVLQANNLVPAETLFLDDNLDNILAAQKLGIQTIHVQAPNTILDYLKNA
jgi:glucose-1-phosphatase